MFVKCPNCKTMFDEKLNVCPSCGLERHILVLAQKSEAEKQELKEAEIKRLNSEKLEKERVEAERKRAEIERAEYERTAPEREEKAKAEIERIKREKIEADRAGIEKREREVAEARSLAKEKAEAESLRLEKFEAEKAEIEKIEREKIALEKLEKTELDQEKLAQEKDEIDENKREKFETEKRKMLEEEKTQKETGELENSEEAPENLGGLIEGTKEISEKQEGALKKKIGKKFLVFALLFLLIAGGAGIFAWGKIKEAAEINVEITSSPAGAEIYLDKLSTGLKTPAIIKNVKIGKHPLTLELKGYVNSETTLSVVDKKNMQNPAMFKLVRVAIPPIKLEVTPAAEGGRTMLPIRPIVEALGGTIDWIIPDKEVRIKANEKVINLWINKNYDNGDGVGKPIDPSDLSIVPIIVNGRTLLPIKFIEEQLGVNLVWDEVTKEVTITFKN